MKDGAPSAGDPAAEAPTRPKSVRWLTAALVFQGLSGVVGGLALVRDPSGAIVRVPASWLEGSPFADYLIPGWILLTGLGLAPLAVAFGLARDRRWALTGAGLVGMALLIWIGVEIMVVGYHASPPLQAIYGALGAAIIVLASWPSARRYLADAEAASPGWTGSANRTRESM